ncbi:MAG: thiamine phosphate synthase [Clostridia bacterium]|nr:thiamine phosphate synthase [Clostridia bacterium]
MKFDPTLYFITDSTGVETPRLLEIVDAACRGGASLVQLREKNRTGREYLSLARAVKAVTDAHHVPLLIDDRADIALAAGASGVHVGSDDLPVADARVIMGPDKIVGATAKTVERALEAQSQGADYLGVGAIYPTTTKVKTVLTSVDTLRDICKTVNIPVCAIGGLNAGNCGVLANTGIAGFCVVSAIMKSPDPEMTARELRSWSMKLKG